MIVFPAIDLRHGRCVRLRQGRPGDETVYDEDPAAVARRWVAEGAEWLHVVNLDGAFGEVDGQGERRTTKDEKAARAPEGRGTVADGLLAVNLRRLAEIRAAVPGIPIQFGGGVRSLSAIGTALELGATRVVLGTAAVRRPALLAAAVRRFCAERIVAGIDAREGRVAIDGWQQPTRLAAEALGREMRRQGVLRAVYTDISRDGMLSGVNVEATVALAGATGLRIVASGGVASLADVESLSARAGEGIEGVIIGQALYTGAVLLPQAIRAAQR